MTIPPPYSVFESEAGLLFALLNRSVDQPNLSWNRGVRDLTLLLGLASADAAGREVLDLIGQSRRTLREIAISTREKARIQNA